MAEGTELLTFCYENQIELLNEALLLGADPGLRDLRGRSGLHISTMRGGDDAVRMLLEAGADANAVDIQGNTPLHMCGHTDTVHPLVKYGACVNARNAHGDTPIVLMYRRGVSADVIKAMEQYTDEEPIEMLSEHLAHRQPTVHGAVNIRTTRVKNIWDEFCNDLGIKRIGMLLILLLCLSLYVAYTITGYSQLLDTRIPIQFDSQRVEL